MAYSLQVTLDDAADDGIWSVGWSSDGIIVTGGCDAIIRSFTVSGDALLRKSEFHGHCLAITSVSVNESMVASSSLDSQVRILDLNAGAEVRAFDAGPMEAWTVAVSQDGGTIASGTQHGSVNIWSVTSGGLLQSLSTGTSAFVMSVACSPSNRHIACATAEGAIFLFDVERMALVTQLNTHAASVRALEFSSDGAFLASGSDDAYVNLYDVSAKGLALNAVLEGHRSWVLGLAFSPDGKLLASCGADRSIRFWDLGTLASAQTISDAHGDHVWSIAFDPRSGQRLASVGEDRRIKIWECL